MNEKMAVAIRVAAAAAIVVVACGGVRGTTTLTRAATAPPVPLDVGLSFDNIAAVPIWAGVDQHIFERYGVQANLVTIRGGSQAMAAMASGKLPILLTAGATIIQPVLNGVPIELVAGLVNVIPYDFLVAPEITTPSQLEGARGGISGFGSADYYAQLYALSLLHVDPKRVVWLQIGTETERLAALRARQIQFTILIVGMDVGALAAGFQPLLKLYETKQPFQHATVAVYKPWAETHKAELRNFLKGLIASIVYWKDPAHVPQVLAIAVRHLHMPAEDLQPGLTLYREKIIPTYPLVTAAGMEFLLKMLQINKPATDFYDNSYVEALQAENFAGTAGR
jgi:ABC-type nitrate/sulfonate/bicarbonate transport system substrate-binding protein